MRKISNAQLASAARLAMLEGRLGAQHPHRGGCCWHDYGGVVCAVGAVITHDEAVALIMLDILGPSDMRPAKMADAPVGFETLTYAHELAAAHDRWMSAGYGKEPVMEHRAEFLRLLDLHDPVKKLADLPALAEPVLTPAR